MLEVVMRYRVEHFSADDAEHFFYPFTTSRSSSAMGSTSR